MRHTELTAERKTYYRFLHSSKAVLSVLVIMTVANLLLMVIALCYGGSLSSVWLIVGQLGFFAVLLVIAVVKVKRKRRILHIAAFGCTPETVHEGLLGEIWQKLKRGERPELGGGKLWFVQECGSIDLQIFCNNHEFNICIDAETICMICDEETDAPIEAEIPLSAVRDADHAFAEISTFVAVHARIQ